MAHRPAVGLSATLGRSASSTIRWMRFAPTVRTIGAVAMNSQTINAAGARLGGWLQRDGWTQLWHAVYLAVLGCVTLVVLADSDVSVAKRIGLGVLAVLAAGWYMLIALRWRYWEAPPLRFALLMAVAAALWVPLVVGHPAYWSTAWAAYGVAACPWLRRSIPTVAILTGLLLVVDQFDGAPLSLDSVTTTIGIGVLVLLAQVTVGAVTHESERRRKLIVELEATRAELAASERAAGEMAERERLARDIHDALAQGFTSIVMLLEAVDAKLPADRAELRAPLDQALQTARESLGEARRIVWALRPDAGPPGALVASLERLAERAAASGDVKVDVVVTGDPEPLDARRELALLRTAQEAVSNARRHAEAATITVTLSWLGDRVILDIADDGRGFDPSVATPVAEGGFGLTSLAERARQAGGELTIDTTPGQGTTISIAFPLEPRSPEQPDSLVRRSTR